MCGIPYKKYRGILVTAEERYLVIHRRPNKYIRWKKQLGTGARCISEDTYSVVHKILLFYI